VVDIVDDEQESLDQPESDGVRVRVALERPDWTGHGDTEEIEAESLVAAQQWDERNWR
jgi:hypothetical protein